MMKGGREGGVGGRGVIKMEGKVVCACACVCACVCQVVS